MALSFVTIGTAKDVPENEEEDIARRRKAEFDNQVVKDKQGRRRFHGAFTGGFSAGFFNTVGTQEGTKSSLATPITLTMQDGLRRPSFRRERANSALDSSDPKISWTTRSRH